MSPQARIYVRSALYALLVLAGVAVLGFVVAPVLGTATGLFAMDTESAAFFSWLTLKGAPYWAGVGVASAPLQGSLPNLGGAARIGVYLANVALAWVVGAAIAFFDLG